MTGMAIVTSSDAPVMLLEVIHTNHSGARRSTYTVKVPYNRLSQTIQSIHRRGGKITGVKRLDTAIALVSEPVTTAAPVELEVTPTASSVEIESVEIESVEADIDIAAVEVEAKIETEHSAHVETSSVLPVTDAGSTDTGFTKGAGFASPKTAARPKSKRKR
jgi:hypothetical protein